MCLVCLPFLVLTFLCHLLVDGVNTIPVKRSNFGQTKTEFQCFLHHWIPFPNLPRDGPRGFSLYSCKRSLATTDHHRMRQTTRKWAQPVNYGGTGTDHMFIRRSQFIICASHYPHVCLVGSLTTLWGTTRDHSSLLPPPTKCSKRDVFV